MLWNLERIRKSLVELSANGGLRIVTVGPLIAGIVEEYEAHISELEATIKDQAETILFANAALAKLQSPSHIESIVCPKCSHIEDATVDHTQPWYSYVHTCTACGYIIMESEWESVDQMIAGRDYVEGCKP